VKPERTADAVPTAIDRDTVAKAPERPLSAQEARLMPIAGDPPFIDGYNPEEDTCVTGNWCGTIETALAIAPENAPEELGCATRITGAHRDARLEANAYEGLSAQRNMQGALNQHGTTLARAEGQQDVCCYHWFEYCSGRPLREGDEVRVAPVRTGSTWSDGDVLEDEARVSVSTATALAQAWLQDAQAEHASVASFHRVALELMAVGAPPELLELTGRAALDEIDHARRCFDLAHRYAGEPFEPGPLPAPAARDGGLLRVAIDAFVEGCVGETIAALVAERALGGATDPLVRETLQVVAEDEARHAALAWRTVAWVLKTAGSERAEIRAALRDIGSHGASAGSPAACDVAPHERDKAWRAHGRLDAHQQAHANRDAWRDIITPMLDRLLE
jgi:hypothetical protein